MLTKEEKENIIEMFKDSLADLYKEKMEFKDLKWKKFIENLDLTIKFTVLAPDWKEIAGIIWYQIRNGKYKISEEPISGVKISIRAPMENVFSYSSRIMSTFKALIGGLKINGKRHLLTLLKVSKLLRVIPEKEYEKYEEQNTQNNINNL